MKKIIYILLLSVSFSYAQDNDKRLSTIKNQLEILSTDTPGLTENVKTEINVSNIKLTNFLLAISEVHKVNFNIHPELDNTQIIVRNFTNVTVTDLLIFLCKEYQLTIDFTGNILSIKKYLPEQIEQKRVIPIVYNPNNNTISIDAKADKLYELFKRISDVSGKNLVYQSGLDNRLLTLYIKDIPIDAAMDKLAFANDLFMEKTKDGFYRFEDNKSQVSQPQINTSGTTAIVRPRRMRSGNFYFKVKDSLSMTLEVDFMNTPIASIITEISQELDLDVFTAKPLIEAGTATFKAKKITYDDLLIKLFEAHQISKGPNNNSTSRRTTTNSNKEPLVSGNSAVFTFKKEDNIYFFGTENQLSVRTVEIIKLQHRTTQLLGDPKGLLSPNHIGSSNFNTPPTSPQSQFDNFGNRKREPINTGSNSTFTNHSSKAEALINILPEELKQDLDVQVDYELNSFYVNGPSAKVERFKKFIQKIDKPVPVVLIEVMIIEVSKSATVDAGVSWGIATEPTTTQGGIYPETDLTLGAHTVNKIIGSFNDFAGFNLGRVGPNFFASIKASETNGDLKVRSTPKLATQNSHTAVFSNSQTSFYAVTQRNIYGTDNPQTSEITNYYPIDAELSLNITPSVTGSGKVILDIAVIQSSFGNRISEDAPPDINSRSFSSIIAMQDKDIAILGGIEEQLKSDRGSGIPFLARVPIIKWLFSKRVREGRKSKLTVLIKPTIIYN